MTEEIHLPDLLTVCQQAAETCLLAHRITQCQQLCDSVLRGVCSSPLESSLCNTGEGALKADGLCRSHNDKPNDDLDISPAQFQPHTDGFHKTCFDLNRRVLADSIHAGWRREKNVVLLMVSRAECALSCNEVDAAFDSLHR